MLLLFFHSKLLTRYETLKQSTHITNQERVKGTLGIGLGLSVLELKKKMKQRKKITLHSAYELYETARE